MLNNLNPPRSTLVTSLTAQPALGYALVSPSKGFRVMFLRVSCLPPGLAMQPITGVGGRWGDEGHG